MQVRSYDLFIDLDFERLRYNGRVLISLKTDQDVVLNSVGLHISRAISGERDFRFSEREDTLIVETGAFDQVLEVDFAGSVPDSLAGIYRAPYDHTYIVTTQLCAAQARRMFPCVDRPDAKAAFKLTVRIDRDLDAISNMPVESVSADRGKKIVAFQKTPSMSTYLLYLGVGKFHEQVDKPGKTEIIVATTPGKVELGRFAQGEAGKAIQYFESYFDIPFALPKVHLIAVPEFAFGAMENWGAITLREIRLLTDANTSSNTAIQVSSTVTHELAHQWFGDLVTMKWWDDIWLNESFATFMSHKAVDSFHPEWRIWEKAFAGTPTAETQGQAMRKDAFETTHPIQIPVNSPDEIEQIFDAISYGKGCHVLRMIEAYVGEDVFRAGVRRFLSTHAYSNATGQDFWEDLEAASGKPVKKIMSHWVLRPGFPLVTASLSGGMLNLRQERFVILGSAPSTPWPIPIVTEINGQRSSILMEKTEDSIDAKDLQSLKINPDRTGFYSVRYVGLDEYVWSAKLTTFDKWGLANDTFSFLLAGMITFQEFMLLVSRFKHEHDTLPVQEVSDQFGLLYSIAPSKISEISKELQKSFLAILDGKTDQQSSTLRGRVATWLALVDPEYAARLCSEFENYSKAVPDMRRAVATAYARSTNDFTGLIRVYRTTSSDEDRVNLLRASAACTDHRTLQRVLDFALSGEVKRQDALSPIFASTLNPQARDIAWDWFQDNIEELRARYQGTGVLSSVIEGIIPILGVGRIEQVESFFGEHMIHEAESGVRSGLQELRAFDRLTNAILQEH